MKNAIIFHGKGGTPESYWHPYVKKELEKRGYKVFVPKLPNPDQADLSEWLPYALANCKFDEETVLIGHSAGCPLILSILENINLKIAQAILVAGFCEQLPVFSDPLPILQPAYSWEKIMSSCREFVFLNSDDDPWGCDDKAGRKMFDNLGGKQIILHGEGHMGSSRYGQMYKEFPLLLKLIAG